MHEVEVQPPVESPVIFWEERRLNPAKVANRWCNIHVKPHGSCTTLRANDVDEKVEDLQAISRPSTELAAHDCLGFEQRRSETGIRFV